MKTPWRTIQVAAQPGDLITSYLILNLNEPNKLGDVSWIKPGKYAGIWWGMHMGKNTWAGGPNHGATTENVKKLIDFAGHHVWVCAAKTSILHGLVDIQHNFVAGCRLHYFLVVTNHKLILVTLAARHLVYITRFEPLNTIELAKPESVFKLTFVVLNIASGFMVCN